MYNETADPKFKFDVKKCTFNDVMHELDEARKTYDGQAQGWNIWRKGLRMVGDYAGTITPWTDLLPSDYGLNFLSAGLKIVIGVRYLPTRLSYCPTWFP